MNKATLARRNRSLKASRRVAKLLSCSVLFLVAAFGYWINFLRCFSTCRNLLATGAFSTQRMGQNFKGKVLQFVMFVKSPRLVVQSFNRYQDAEKIL
jgi:hypothetical protein